MAVVTRPPTLTTFKSNQDTYLIYNVRVPYTCRIMDRTTLVIFPNINHAHFIRNVLEAHYTQHKTWPDMTHKDLFFNLQHDTTNILDIVCVDPNDIFEMCLKLNVNACVVEDIEEFGNKVSIRCDIIDLEPRADTYRDTLESIYLV
jgi:hypothetical protein